MNIEKARQRLQQIDQMIHFCHPPDRYHVGYNQIFLAITLKEWETIKKDVLDWEFPCEVRSAVYGFHLLVRDRQDYLQGECGGVLLLIEHTQFPFAVTVDRVGGQVGTLRALEQLVYRARNQELLEWYGLPPLESDITRCAY